MRFDGKTTKRKITKWGLGELSSVKSGAQAPAKATILKTNGDDLDTALLAAGFTLDETLVVKSAIDVTGDISKQVETLAAQFGKAMTASVNGEPHPASDFAYVPDKDKPSTWKLPIFDASHVSAALAALCKGLRGKKVSIPDDERGKVIATVRRAYREHYPDKELPELLEKSGDNQMPDTKTPEQLQKELNAATARSAELEVLAKMSDAEKTYMGKMSDEDKKKFMAMDAEGRKKAMGVAKAADETFTDTMGQTIAKSEVGEAAFVVMKNQNEQIAKMQEDTAQREALELVKSLCPNLPGEAGAMAGAIRKCKASLSTDEFSVLEKALKAGDNAMQARTVAKAHDKPVGSDDAQTAYNEGIAKIQSDKQITKSAAMQTPEGHKLAKTLRDAQAEENE